jgi:hypothetical protein
MFRDTTTVITPDRCLYQTTYLSACIHHLNYLTMSSLQRQFCLSSVIVPRIPPRAPRFLNARSAHTNTNPRLLTPLRRANLRRISLASGAVLGGSILLVQNAPDDTKPGIQDANNPAARQPPSLTSMLRSYVVYAMCSIPALVDWSPKILSTLLSIPVMRDLTESLVRATFFAQVINKIIYVFVSSFRFLTASISL